MNPKPSFLEGFKQKLKIRNPPKTQKEFFLNIKEDEGEEEGKELKEKKEKSKDVEEKEEREEKDVEEEEEKKPTKHKVQIIDKSATVAIDRDLIMKRINFATRQLKIGVPQNTSDASASIDAFASFKEAKTAKLKRPFETVDEQPIVPEKPIIIEEEKSEPGEAKAEPVQEPPVEKIKIKIGKKRVTIKAATPAEEVITLSS